MPPEITYPIRLNRYLALQGICSRREADDFISKGLVTLNGQKAKLGAIVKAGDAVLFDAPKKATLKEYLYFAYNKPRGIVTHSPEEGQRDIRNTIEFPAGVFPIGRLDRDSHGLILLSNDGRITDRLLNPSHEHEKEYIVRVDKPVTPMFLKLLGQGVKLEDFTTKPCRVERTGRFSFRIILTEGKKHQIRRMCAALGLVTLDLKRVRVLNIQLGILKIGQHRKIKGQELEDLLEKIGVSVQ